MARWRPPAAGPRAVKLVFPLGKPGKGREELQGAASARISAPAETATTAQKLSGEEGMGSSFPFLVEQKLAFR